MSTKQQLRSRWQTPEGEPRVKALMAALSSGAPTGQLAEIVKGLPYAEETAPALDLRGLRFKELLTLHDLDLSGARLDYAVLGGHLVNCRLVGATLDGFEAVNLSLQQDFTRASFVGANLKGARFTETTLVGANFTKAKLASANLARADCTGALFVEADLRFATCASTDFRGANLSSARLNDASLGSVLFDAQTRFDGADLTGAAMDADLAQSAAHAATVRPGQGDYELAEFDAALAVLKQRNRDGHLRGAIERMEALRPRMQHEAGFDWGSQLSRELPAAIMAEVTDAVQEGGSNLSRYA
jgi:uncharacterized protein YjbI with pentapeptide repeats